MYLELWQIGLLIFASGFWAEYRNIQGQKTGYVNGVVDIILNMKKRNIIDIDPDGRPVARRIYGTNA